MLGRAIDVRLRKLEGARRGGVFFVVWGRSVDDGAMALGPESGGADQRRRSGREGHMDRSQRLASVAADRGTG
jgi:hypothetical protein